MTNTANTNAADETECQDCGVEYVERGRQRLCECNATEEDMEEMSREHMAEGREFNRAMREEWS